jgi:hypothetical protein
MIGVICAQRDRLKARVAQLEEEYARVRTVLCTATTWREELPCTTECTPFCISRSQVGYKGDVMFRLILHAADAAVRLQCSGVLNYSNLSLG